MRKIIVLTILGVLFISCHKKEGNQPEKTKINKIEKGEYFSTYNKKESYLLKYNTDSLLFFFDKNQLNRVEVKIFAESYGEDSPSSYIRSGYHINKNNFFDATVYINDTLTTGNKGLDYPIEYEEYYDFYRVNYTFSYSSKMGKNIENYFKSDEMPSKGYFTELLSLDIALAKANFPIEKAPKSLYEIKNNKDMLYASQDSIRIYDIKNTSISQKISSSNSFLYLREICEKKTDKSIKYLAKIHLEKEGLKYIDLKEIEGVQISDPNLDSERFVTNRKGLELYDGESNGSFFGKKEHLILNIPYGQRIEIESFLEESVSINGKKGKLVSVIYDKEGETQRGVVFSGYLSINKPY